MDNEQIILSKIPDGSNPQHGTIMGLMKNGMSHYDMEIININKTPFADVEEFLESRLSKLPSQLQEEIKNHWTTFKTTYAKSSFFIPECDNILIGTDDEELNRILRIPKNIRPAQHTILGRTDAGMSVSEEEMAKQNNSLTAQ